jgi:5'-nucleotidase
MSAAVEAIEGIPAIGFSLLDYDWNADFESIKLLEKSHRRKILYQKMSS